MIKLINSSTINVSRVYQAKMLINFQYLLIYMRISVLNLFVQ